MMPRRRSLSHPPFIHLSSRVYEDDSEKRSDRVCVCVLVGGPAKFSLFTGTKRDATPVDHHPSPKCQDDDYLSSSLNRVFISVATLISNWHLNDAGRSGNEPLLSSVRRSSGCDYGKDGKEFIRPRQKRKENVDHQQFSRCFRNDLCWLYLCECVIYRH